MAVSTAARTADLLAGAPLPAPDGDQELDTVEMTINMGPQHPSTHGVFRIVLQLEGERIRGVTPHIGYSAPWRREAGRGRQLRRGHHPPRPDRIPLGPAQ